MWICCTLFEHDRDKSNFKIPAPERQWGIFSDAGRCLKRGGWGEEAEAQTQPWAVLSAFGQCPTDRETRRRRCSWRGGEWGIRVRESERELKEEKERVAWIHEGECTTDREGWFTCANIGGFRTLATKTTIVTFAGKPYFVQKWNDMATDLMVSCLSKTWWLCPLWQ